MADVLIPWQARKCRQCREPYHPLRPMQVACSPACALKLAARKRGKEEAKAAKVERAQIRVRKAELKPLQYWLKRAEKACNAYIRERDKGLPCISCGVADSPEWHAGHFIPATAHAIRFDPANIHKQCAKCNVFLGGNQTNYELRLAARIGQSEVDRLKNAPRARKWTREECQGVEAQYKAMAKALA